MLHTANFYVTKTEDGIRKQVFFISLVDLPFPDASFGAMVYWSEELPTVSILRNSQIIWDHLFEICMRTFGKSYANVRNAILTCL